MAGSRRKYARQEMGILDGRWLGVPGRTPRLSDPSEEPFFRRHFWPPDAWGAIAIALVLSVVIGFVAALIYVSTEPAVRDSNDPAEAAEGPAGAEEGDAAGTTTTRPEVLSPEALAKKVAPSVWSVNTLDEAGRPTSGSAFAASSAPGQTLLLTSLEVVQASTRQPSPDIVVRNGGTEVKATLWTWQEDIDMALLVINRSQPALKWADDEAAPKPGDKLFVAVGSGGVAPGVVGAMSPSSIQHNIFTDEGRRGAALVSDKGEVIGMASLAFNPGGAGTDRIFFGVPVRSACVRVLACGGGNTDPGATPTSIAPPPGGTTTTAPGGNRATTTTARGATATTVLRPTTTANGRR